MIWTSGQRNVITINLDELQSVCGCIYCVYRGGGVGGQNVLIKQQDLLDTKGYQTDGLWACATTSYPPGVTFILQMFSHRQQVAVSVARFLSAYLREQEKPLLVFPLLRKSQLAVYETLEPVLASYALSFA